MNFLKNNQLLPFLAIVVAIVCAATVLIFAVLPIVHRSPDFARYGLVYLAAIALIAFNLFARD